jgi:uncharacterized membrane protein YhaH (DUF805 family)
MNPSPREQAEARARQRFVVMTAARVFAVAQVMVGFALTRTAPDEAVIWGMGVFLAVVGLLEFFFVPALLAKRWKAADRAGDDRRP